MSQGGEQLCPCHDQHLCYSLISIFLQVSVGEETSFSLALFETLKTVSAVWRPIQKNLCKMATLKKKKKKIGFENQLLLYAGQKYCRMLQGEYSAILWTSLSYHLSLRLLFCIF